MKRLDQFLQSIDLENEYSPHLSEKETNEILNRILPKIDSTHRYKKQKKLWKTLLVAACVMIIGASSVFAIQYFVWHEDLAQYFHATPVQQDALKEAVNTPQCTATSNGITVNVLQTLSDTKNIYVLYEILLPDNMTFTDTMHFEEDVYGINSEVLEQEGNRRTVLLHLNLENQTDNQMIHLNLKNLCEYIPDERSGKSYEKCVIEGSWSLSWPFDANTHTKIKTITPHVEATAFSRSKQQTQTAIIEKIVLSPLSIAIDCNVNNAKDNLDRIFDTWITVQMKDGSSFTCGQNDIRKSYGVVNGVGKMYFYFNQILDMDEIDKIIIGDAVISVN